jgi:hypothetical protein
VGRAVATSRSLPTGASDAEQAEAARAGNRCNIDLWTGLGMLVFGCLMIFWALSRPVMPEPSEKRREGSGRIRRATAT